MDTDKSAKNTLVNPGLKRCFGSRYLRLEIERRIKQHGTICYHLLGKESLNTPLEPAFVQMFSMRLTMMVMMPTRLLICAQQKTSEHLEQHAFKHNGLRPSSSF